MERNYQLIGVASCWGAQIRTCEDGPVVLKNSGCLERFKQAQIPIFDWETIYPEVCFKEKQISLKDSLPLIADVSGRLADKVFDAMNAGNFPVAIVGDHSTAIGTWNGVGSYLSQLEHQPLGLIWIDAHMDAHTEETTPSGAWHGMPVAALLGNGNPALVQLKRARPVIQPEHLCLIGVRSFEEGEAKLLKDLNVRVYFMDEVKRRGFHTVLQEAIAIASKDTVGYGVSLDMDVIDPAEAPGVGSPEENGLCARELLEAIPLFGRDPHLKAFELVEFNPHLDKEGMTCRLCEDILSTFLNTRSLVYG